MEWTKEKPKEPGWYWAREFARIKAPPIICRVHRQIDGSLVVRSDKSDYPIDEIDYAEWQGPIVPDES
jgi:hypothetical protein